ncbi:MAG: hypothetical protein JWO54_615 [Candidatus Saccharibacteria bacterium]|jgi:hypothetical protein|nr:hypothetical protein [Candidatus Saccharibacteria bacterium]MDB5180855.1 hypothetical protein [Candidatus Saccharibacteria bacterium]
MGNQQHRKIIDQEVHEMHLIDAAVSAELDSYYEEDDDDNFDAFDMMEQLPAFMLARVDAAIHDLRVAHAASPIFNQLVIAHGFNPLVR